MAPIEAMPILHAAKDIVAQSLPQGLPGREPLAWGLAFELCVADMLAGQGGYTLSPNLVIPKNYETN